MTKRTLTIRLEPDLEATLRRAARKVSAKTYQGEELAFESPASFFGRLTERRWEMVHAMQGRGPMSFREIARLVERDVKRVHEDVAELIELGLLERGDDGVVCPFAKIRVDFEMEAKAA